MDPWEDGQRQFADHPISTSTVGAVSFDDRHHEKFARSLRPGNRAVRQPAGDFFHRTMRSARAVRGKAILRRKDCSLHASATHDGHTQIRSAAKLGSYPSSGTSLLHGPEGAQFPAGTAKLSAHTPPA